MSMTPEEKSLVEAAYTRVQVVWGTRAGLNAMMFFGQIVVFSLQWWKELHAPPSSIHSAVILSGLLGAFIGATLLLALFLSIRHKQDKRLVRIFEERFPDECRKMEEAILAKEGNRKGLFED